MFECDREISIIRRPCPARDCCLVGKKTGYPLQKGKNRRDEKRGEQKEDKEKWRQEKREKDIKDENSVNSKLKNTKRSGDRRRERKT